MHFMMIIVISLSVLGMFTLFSSGKRFGRIEIIAYYLVISELSTQTFGIIANNLEMIVPSKQIGMFWIYNAKLFIIIPCFTIWLFSLYFLQSMPLYLKGLLTIGLLVGLSGIDLMFNRFGFITFRRWNFGYSLIEWLIVVLGSLCYILLFRKLLRKQACA